MKKVLFGLLLISSSLVYSASTIELGACDSQVDYSVVENENGDVGTLIEGVQCIHPSVRCEQVQQPQNPNPNYFVQHEMTYLQLGSSVSYKGVTYTCN